MTTYLRKDFVACACLSWALVKFYVCPSFHFGVEGGMWDAIVLIPDRCLFIYFVWTFFLFFSHLSILCLSPSLRETARYRLQYCLKEPLSPNNQPTNKQVSFDLTKKMSGHTLCLGQCFKET